MSKHDQAMVVEGLLTMAAYLLSKEKFVKSTYAEEVAPYIANLTEISEALEEILEAQLVAKITEGRGECEEENSYFVVTWFVDAVAKMTVDELIQAGDVLSSREFPEIEDRV